MALASKLFSQAGEDLQQALESIDDLQSRVVIIDNDKLPYDQAIEKLDKDLPGLAGPRGELLLDTEDISLEVLRKIQDKHYEIDVEYERTRDLYEK